MNLAFYKAGQLHRSILGLLFLAGLLVLWQWVIWQGFKRSYTSWCLEFGPSVLLLNALIAAIWSGFDDLRELVSANPFVFLAAWLAGATGIPLAFANATVVPRGPTILAVPGPDRVREVAFVWIVMLVVLVAVLLWLLLFMPFLYFVFLLSASPVRMALRSQGAASTKFEKETVFFNDQSVGRFEFDQRPVASAFALSSLMMLAVKLAMAELGISA